MTTKESFEAWYDDESIVPLPDDYTILGKRYLYMGWCAATTEANKRIAELESEVAELENSLQKIVEVLAAGADLNESYRKTIDAYEKAHKAALEEKTQARHDEALAYKHYHELKASNNDFRAALEEIKSLSVQSDDGYLAQDIAEKALQATPAESLQAFENEVIEKCAKVCIAKANELKELIDQDCIVGKADTGAIVCAQEIRSLKEVK